MFSCYCAGRGYSSDRIFDEFFTGTCLIKKRVKYMLKEKNIAAATAAINITFTMQKSTHTSGSNFYIFFYSGLLLSKEEGNTSSFEINIRFSGQFGYLHFYSDAAYTMQGFNISYRLVVVFSHNRHGTMTFANKVIVICERVESLYACTYLFVLVC